MNQLDLDIIHINIALIRCHESERDALLDKLDLLLDLKEERHCGEE